MELTEPLYRWLGKADFEAGTPINYMRFVIPYQKHFIPEPIAEYKFPESVSKVEIMAKPEDVFLGAATLLAILQANWDGKIQYLSINEWYLPAFRSLVKKTADSPIYRSPKSSIQGQVLLCRCYFRQRNPSVYYRSC